MTTAEITLQKPKDAVQLDSVMRRVIQKEKKKKK